jgi:hypothetical protein
LGAYLRARRRASNSFHEEENNAMRNLWRWWKQAAKKIGDFQARFVLTVLYFVMVAPFALIIRHSDPLSIKDGASRGWRVRQDVKPLSIGAAQRQF